MAYALLENWKPMVGPCADLLAEPGEFAQILGPVIAGARARGIADALEMMGIAGVLIDRAGRVLHASAHAERALLPTIRIVGDHLVGCDSDVNERLQKIMSQALKVGSKIDSVAFLDSNGEPHFSMKAMRVPQDDAPSVQLLCAVLVISESVL